MELNSLSSCGDILAAASSKAVFGDTISRAQEAVTRTLTNAEKFSDIVSRAQAKDKSWVDDNKDTDGIPVTYYHSGGLSAGADKIADGGSATYTRNSRKVVPSLSDFVIDVQNTAKRLLTPFQFSYFMQTYFKHFLAVAEVGDKDDWTGDGKDIYFEKFLTEWPEWSRQVIVNMDGYIRETLGAAFEERGIYPFQTYMNAERMDVYLKRQKEVVQR